MQPDKGTVRTRSQSVQSACGEPGEPVAGLGGLHRFLDEESGAHAQFPRPSGGLPVLLPVYVEWLRKRDRVRASAAGA